MFSMATLMVALVAPIQIVADDLHGLNTLEHQLQKVMAMEGSINHDDAPLDPDPCHPRLYGAVLLGIREKVGARAIIDGARRGRRTVVKRVTWLIRI